MKPNLAETPREAVTGLPTGLIIFCPAFLENVNAQTMVSISKVAHIMGCLDVDVTIATMSFPDITTLRNAAFTAFTDGSNASHILWVDADMAFEPQLILDMIAWDVPLIGSVYPQKRYDDDDMYKKYWVLNAGKGNRKISDDGNYLEVDGLGFGIVLMRRDCGDLMKKTYPELKVTDMEGDALGPALAKMGVHHIWNFFDLMKEPSGKKISEDYSFCKRYKEAGGEVWACINHTIKHTGPRTWVGNFGEQGGIIRSELPPDSN